MNNHFKQIIRKGLTAPTLAAALLAASAFGPISQGRALAAEVDFTGKSIEFLTAHRGAESVLSLQTWTKYMSKYMKGNPEITVRSKFGGGGVTASNYFAGVAKPDGLTAAMLNLPAFIAHAIGRDGAQADPTKFEVIAGESAVYVHVAGKASDVQSADEMTTDAREHTFGTRSRNFNVMSAEILWKAIGSPVRVVAGFQGTENMIQAMASNELDLGYIFLPAWIRSEKNYADLGLTALYQLGMVSEEGEIVRSPLIPDIPTATELYLKAQPDMADSEDFRALQTGIIMYQVGKMFFLPEGTPADIVDAWRTAADKAAKDPEFIAEHTRLIGFPLDYVPAAQAVRSLNDGMTELSKPFFQEGGAGYELVVGKSN